VNFYRLGRWAAVWGTLVVALLTLVGLLALTVVTNSILPSIGMSVPLFILLWVAAKGLQGGAYEEHLNKGGEAASGGAAAGIGLLGLGLFVLLGMGGGLLWDLVWQARLGDKLTFGSGEEVYYARGATQAEAAQVGRHLQAVGFFDGRSPKTVLLAREGPRTVVSFVVLKHALSDPQVLQFFRDFGRELSQQDFGGRPVEIRLCDEHLNIQKTLP